MPLPALTSADVGAAARDKINLGLSEIDRHETVLARLFQLVGAKADQGGLAGLEEQVNFALRVKADRDTLNAVESGLRADLSTLRTAVTDGFADAERRDAANLLTTLAVILMSGRIDVCPAAFARSALGDLAANASLTASDVATTDLGRGYRIDGPGIVAPRASVAVDPDTIRIVRAEYWRVADVLDPNNNAVDLAIQWLDVGGASAGTTLIKREVNLRVQDGPRLITARVPSLTDAAPTITPPRGATAWRPLLRTYGADGATVIRTLDVADATYAGAYVPDVSALADRLRTIEAQLQAGLPLTTPILPSFAVADLPRPGNRGRKAFARDGRAPNAAGTLEAANRGTGVEIVDNGVRWVIAGTNQQVQA